MKRENLTPAALFFYENAGYGYDPLTETAEAGRVRGSLALERAEQMGNAAGWCVCWGVDPDVTSADWVEDGQPGSTGHDPWATWQATCYGPEPDDESPREMLECLGGVDFGPDCIPWREAYARVIAAELFMQALGNL